MDEISILLAQSDLRRENLLARAQSLSAAVHFESATFNIPNDAEVEPLTPRTNDIGVDPMFLEFTTMGIANIIPIYHTADYEFLEGNPCSSDVKDELITTSPSTSPMKEERVPSTPNSCSATNCATRILSANAVLEAKTALTPNIFQNNLSTTPMDSVCDSHVPETMSLLSTSRLLPDLLKESIEPRSAKHFYLGRPTNLRHAVAWFFSQNSTSWSYYSSMMDVVPVVQHAQPWKHFYHGHTERKDIGVAALRTSIPDSVQDPNYPCILRVGHYLLIPGILISRRMLND